MKSERQGDGEELGEGSNMEGKKRVGCSTVQKSMCGKGGERGWKWQEWEEKSPTPPLLSDPARRSLHKKRTAAAAMSDEGIQELEGGSYEEDVDG